MANMMPTEVTEMGYQEAHKQFLSWRPETLQREGPMGMTFDYLPVPQYKKYLDGTVGPENWESDTRVGEKGVSVVLSVFGVRKSSSSSIWPAGKIKQKDKNTGDIKYVENPQPNEVEKAEARAWRRAAADHGMLSHLWDKENNAPINGDGRPTRSTSRPAQTTSRGGAVNRSVHASSVSPAQVRHQDGNGQGDPGASPAQIDLMVGRGKHDGRGLHVPLALAESDAFTKGRDGTASAFVSAVLEIKKAVDDYDDDPARYIEEALNNIGLSQLIPLLDEADDLDPDL